MNNTARKTCGPCSAGALEASGLELKQFQKEHPDWKISEEEGVRKLKRKFDFSNYQKALHFTNQLAHLAEFEDHHPAIMLEWGRATVYWWTHKVGGIHRNDLIMAKETDNRYHNRNPDD